MNFKDMLEKISLLSEATKETPTGKVHKAEPGGYGRKYDTDEEGDEKKAAKADAPKRGRGRPKKGADDAGEVKTYDTKTLGGVFGGGKKPKKEVGKVSKKHSLKEYFDSLDSALNEMQTQQPIPVVSKQGATQSTGAGFIHIDDTSPAGKAMSDALGKLAQQKKAQIVVPTAQQATQQKPTATAGGATNQPAMSEKWEGGAEVEKTGEYAGKTTAELKSMLAKLHKSGPHKRGSPEEKKMHQINFALRAKGGWKKGEGAASREDMAEADMPPQDSMASPLTLEGKGSKPDFLDLDKDGNKKESMKKAAKDKKKVDEGMEHKLKAARHAGKAHALAKEGYNCRYDDMEEARHYHEGYKEGLDECYGQMPIQGYVGETTPPATVPGMANQAEHDDVEEGNAFTAALAKTPKGGKFSVGGKTFTDRTNYDAKVTESPFAFEAWDNQLSALLEGKEEVAEGMTVSISKGQQGMPDSVSVTAQDQEADQLLGLIKQAGLGLFGGDEAQPTASSPMSLQPADGEHGAEEIGVVGDHDGMMDLIKKVTGASVGPQGGEISADHDADYEEEGGETHDHEHTDEETCNECGMYESKCECDHEKVDEVESEDQMTYQVAEDNPPDSGAEEFQAMDQEIAQDNAAASSHGGAQNSNLEEESEEEEDDHAEEAGEKVTKDIEYDDKKDKKLDEWANEAGKKGTDTTFEQDIDYMMNVITGGLNKRKVTGQTTIPVIASQTNRQVSHNTTDINESTDDVAAWKKLAGI
jgi:hypothetical protein